MLVGQSPRTAETDALSNILAANTAMHWVLLLTAFCRCQRPPRSPVRDAVWGLGRGSGDAVWPNWAPPLTRVVSNPVVQRWSTGDTRQCLETQLVVTAGGETLLGSHG